MIHGDIIQSPCFNLQCKSPTIQFFCLSSNKVANEICIPFLLMFSAHRVGPTLPWNYQVRQEQNVRYIIMPFRRSHFAIRIGNPIRANHHLLTFHNLFYISIQLPRQQYNLRVPIYHRQQPSVNMPIHILAIPLLCWCITTLCLKSLHSSTNGASFRKPTPWQVMAR